MTKKIYIGTEFTGETDCEDKYINTYIIFEVSENNALIFKKRLTSLDRNLDSIILYYERKGFIVDGDHNY